MGRQEITSQDVHNRLHLICSSYTSQENWRQLAIKYPDVFYRKDYLIRRIISCLTDDGFITDRRLILQNMWLFLFSVNVLKGKISAIRVLSEAKLPGSETVTPETPDWFKVSLIPFSEKVIFWLMDRFILKSESDVLMQRLHNFNDRIDFLSEKLEVFHCDLVSKLDQDQMHRLILRPQQQLEDLLKLYTDIGLKASDLRSHLWLLSRTVSGLTPRIEQLLIQRVKIKPWMLSAPYTEFSRILQQAHILNEFQTVHNVLMKRLNVDLETAKSMSQQNSSLSGKAFVPHVDRVIDFLLSEGFSQAEIVKSPKALTMSLDKVKTRVEEIKACGCPSLLVHIHENPHTFETIVDQALRDNEKALN